MSKKITLLVCTTIAFLYLAGQDRDSIKPAVTPKLFGMWPFVSFPIISNDGNYVFYSINDPSIGKSIRVIQSIHSDWKFVMDASQAVFTADSKFAVLLNKHDSLGIVRLGDRNVIYIRGVNSFQLPKNGNAKWLAYHIKPSGKLILRNLETGREDAFEAVNNYLFSDDGKALVIQTLNETGRVRTESIKWISPDQHELITIWSGENMKAKNYFFSNDCSKIAFTVESEQDTKKNKSIWYFKKTFDKAILLAKDSSVASQNNLSIDHIDFRGFSNDGEKLFISYKEADRRVQELGLKGIDVWSYSDANLQSHQMKQLTARQYQGVIDIDKKRIIRLEQANEQIIAVNNQYALVSNIKGFGGTSDEGFWNKECQTSVYVISLVDGARRLVNSGFLVHVNAGYWFSPEGKYIIYYDGEKRNYFSYDVATGSKRNITASISGDWTTYVKRDVPNARYMPIYSGDAGGTKDDKSILLYGQYDIYEVDPLGKTAPINLTNGMGKKKNIEFKLALERGEVFEGSEKIIISAFNRNTKDDGFYQMCLGRQKNPDSLCVQPYMFKGTWEDDNNLPQKPVKAKNENIYLVRRMSAEESPNYFWTKDFKTFNRITNIHPEKDFNWIKTELFTWKLPDGSTSQGILYKPENFDASKKYPLIFNYYENSSEGLHGFIMPNVGHSDLEIPYYVSNGYLVFKPDMHYKIGHPGMSVVNTVVSAAKYLCKRSYVDVKRIGIQGHSRGGWETNFILTHTNIFAAAMSSAGMSDYISLYNLTRSRSIGTSRQPAFENSYQRIGATLWQRPDLFIENSPIFMAQKVTTPVLIMANKDDSDVPFEQGLEFFTALRRLGKRSWMLQYDGEGHLVFDEAAEDRSIRMKQFFDHYLKDSACPRWMLYGVPASEKGNPDALQLVYEKDPKTGKWLTPKEGSLLTEEEKKKVEALKRRKPVTITF